MTERERNMVANGIVAAIKVAITPIVARIVALEALAGIPPDADQSADAIGEAFSEALRNEMSQTKLERHL